MADIRCPMCSKPNPDHLEVCQFCQARLKPLMAGSQGQDNDLPDWLRSLGGDEPADSGPADSGPADRGGVGEPEDAAEDGLDWLDRLGGESDAQSGPDSRSQAPEQPFVEQGGSDWLSGFRDLGGTDNFDDLPEDEFEAEAESEVPDWMHSAGVAPVDADENGVPDWLDSLGSRSEAQPEPESEPESDFPDWLSSLDGAESKFAAEDERPESFGDAEPAYGDWFAADSADADAAGEPVQSASPGETPAWLSDLGGSDFDAPLDEEQPEALMDGEAAFGDWFASDSDDAEAAEEVLPAAAAGELPDWLTKFDPPASAEQPAAAAFDSDEDAFPGWQPDEIPERSPVEPVSTGELPDWLAVMGESAGAMAVEAPSSQEEDADFGDWFSDQVEPASEISASETADADAQAEPGDLPDWLNDISGAPVQEDGPLFAAEPEEQEGLPAWLEMEAGEPAFTSDQAAPTEEPQEGMPDWLSEMDGFSVPEETGPGFVMEDAEFGARDSRAMPAWLDEGDTPAVPAIPFDDGELDLSAGRGTAPFVDDGEYGDDLLDSSQLPDWLASETGQEQVAALEDELAQADLPSWVQAMRPVDTASQKTAESGPVEMAGPLAGLHSVLSAEPEIAQLKKPPAYSLKLKYSDTQQSRSTVFEELLETEGRPQPIPRPPLVSSQKILRAIIGAVMLLLIGLVVIADSQMTPMPKIIDLPGEVRQASMLVERLAPESKVLMVFDYEPGFSGEMNVTAAAVVNHLMLKGSRLTLISTSPTGPALAEYFIHTIQAQHDYQSGLQYVNLGYVPGGVSGLFTFAEIPQLVTEISFDGLDAWETEPLQGIGKLADFAMMVLITDNPNTARAWIEQVEPKLDADTPLIAVISAQAEPLVRPYYGEQNAQVDGMVSGLVGGAYYEQATGPSLARTYWDAFNLGLILAVAAILIGGVLQLISLLLARRAEKQGEAA